VVNLWLAPDGEASRARQITSGAEREDGWRGLAWTPDGKIVYRSLAGGHPNVWIIEADGAGNKQLSANAVQNIDPAVSPDGRYVVWARRMGNLNIWRMEIDGSNPRQLGNSVGELTSQVSPDGKWVVYSGVGNESLWKIPIDGGDPVQVTDKPATLPVFSPNGKLIACNYLDEASGQYKIAVIPFEGGPPTRLFDILGSYQRPLQWTPDGGAVAFIRTSNRVSNLWAQPLAGGEPKQLTDFKDQRIFNFAWSRDGKQLALARGVVNSDVVLISGLKKP
jgi:Tol biopolymer transport system component